MHLHSRKHPRWKGYDYSSPGAYFVTTITRHRTPLLGHLARNSVVLSRVGRIVQDTWVRIPTQFPVCRVDALVVMPDHVHAILVLAGPQQTSRPTTVFDIVGWAKSRATASANATGGTRISTLWQRSFHDRIVRDARALERIRRYIANNPMRACAAAPRDLP